MSDATPPPPSPPPPPVFPPLRGPALPLPAGFPRVSAYVVTYPANRRSLGLMLADFRRSDWGVEPTVIDQPADWPRGLDSSARNYKRALEQAAADGCDFALVLEDDVRVTRRLRHNLFSVPLVQRDQCDYLGLYIPDLIQTPWRRKEPHLGYRLAKPLYAGPNETWQKFRLWGCQALLLSRRFVLAALDRWDALPEGQDTRVIIVAGERRVPLWYTDPCLAEHMPLVTAFRTPLAHAPDFDAACELDVGPGFQPPEAVPGWLTEEEGELLWQAATGRRVLHLGTKSGRLTVCLAQSAAEVVSVDTTDPAQAAEWCRRYGVEDRVVFVRGDVAQACRGLAGPFDLAVIDTDQDQASVARDIAAVLPLLAPGGRLAVHDYPDPGWPAVRQVVDTHARKLGWRRIAQAGYLGVFDTGTGRP